MRRKGFSKEHSEIVNLLAIEVSGEKKMTLDLRFSGDACVRLFVGELEMWLEDVGMPFPVLWRPRHGDILRS